MGAGDICVLSNLAMAQATQRILATVLGANVFTVGDNSNESGSANQYATCIGPSWGLLKNQTRPVPGNHDYGSSGAAPYFAYYGAQAGTPGKGYYSYDLAGWHVIALNSECANVAGGGCAAGSAQELWLKADLAAHPAACTIAYWHRPTFSSGSSGGSTAYRAFWDDLYAAGTEIVIGGHDHNYERFAPQTPAGIADPARGIRQFVVGTGGSFFTGVGSAHANSQVRKADVFGVLKLTLHPGSYDFQFLPVPGSTFTDSGSGTCH
jgi:3',5'-cyclic AMP phosphodiesterase CpdA